MQRLGLLGTLFTLGCLPDIDVDAGDNRSDADADTAACGVDIRETFPAMDATDFYYRGNVEFHLNKADDTAVASVEGVAGTSRLNERNDIVSFTPDAPLAPSTSYTATLSYCTGNADFSFSTSDLGGTLEGEDVLEGAVYSLDLTTGRIVIPEGVGAVLQEYLEFQLMLSPTAFTDTSITMLGALADEEDPNHQDWCSPSIPFPAGDLDGSYFQIGPQSTTIAVADYEITIDGLLISGTFSPDGTWFGGGVFAGNIDTRPLVPLLFEGEDDPNAICSFLTGFGVVCEDCQGDPDVPYCLEIKAIDLLGATVEDAVPLEDIDFEDCHENCEDTWVIDEATQQPVEDSEGNWTHINESCDLEQPVPG